MIPDQPSDQPEVEQQQLPLLTVSVLLTAVYTLILGNFSVAVPFHGLDLANSSADMRPALSGALLADHVSNTGEAMTRGLTAAGFVISSALLALFITPVKGYLRVLVLFLLFLLANPVTSNSILSQQSTAPIWALIPALLAVASYSALLPSKPILAQVIVYTGAVLSLLLHPLGYATTLALAVVLLADRSVPQRWYAIVAMIVTAGAFRLFDVRLAAEFGDVLPALTATNIADRIMAASQAISKTLWLLPVAGFLLMLARKPLLIGTGLLVLSAPLALTTEEMLAPLAMIAGLLFAVVLSRACLGLPIAALLLLLMVAGTMERRVEIMTAAEKEAAIRAELTTHLAKDSVVYLHPSPRIRIDKRLDPLTTVTPWLASHGIRFHPAITAEIFPPDTPLVFVDYEAAHGLKVAHRTATPAAYVTPQEGKITLLIPAATRHQFVYLTVADYGIVRAWLEIPESEPIEGKKIAVTHTYRFDIPPQIEEIDVTIRFDVIELSKLPDTTLRYQILK